MELLEMQDPEKKKLIEASERHKRALEKEVGDISDKTQRVLTNALLIGGALALSYVIIRQLSKGKSKKKKAKAAKVTAVNNRVSNEDDEDDDDSGSPSLLSDIGTKIANQATVILVDIARQKLMEYLESRKKTDEAA